MKTQKQNIQNKYSKRYKKQNSENNIMKVYIGIIKKAKMLKILNFSLI
jgi:hypothetical protein